MPVIFQKWIYRDDLVNNPEVLYVFGDNMARKGFGGQAKEMRGEPNAVGIATKMKPSQFENSFFSDEDFPTFLNRYLEDVARVDQHLKAGGIVVIPLDGLGTGLSELPTRAPRINAYLIAEIKRLKNYYG